MRNLFIKKTFLGLVGLITVLSLLAYPGQVRNVEAGGGTAYLPVVSSGASALQTTNQVFFGVNASWKYWDKGQLGTDWALPTFNDSTWPEGSAPLGYGNGAERTVVGYGSSSSSKNITTYFRKTFTIENAAAVSALSIDLNRDDAAVIYLNGKLATRSNMPSGDSTYSTLAYECSEGNVTKAIDPALLVTGANTLAVEIHQCSASSSDIAFS
ncbi:MAG TPA: hypothetical protein VEC37_14280, partial [Bacillota bacterium]|nr:hypothetical protein [Bacillota bacterium]